MRPRHGNPTEVTRCTRKDSMVEGSSSSPEDGKLRGIPENYTGRTYPLDSQTKDMRWKQSKRVFFCFCFVLSFLERF